MNAPFKRPGGAMAKRELHFIWMLDTSGSMNVDGKIQSLNFAIRETITLLQAMARDNPNVEVLVRALTFSSGARWVIAEPTPVAAMRWSDVEAKGYTDMGAALALAATALAVPPMPERAVSPVIVLVTDGHHTDDFEAGLAKLTAERWGREAVRQAIAIGRDVSYQSLRALIATDRCTLPAACHRGSQCLGELGPPSRFKCARTAMPCLKSSGKVASESASTPMARNPRQVNATLSVALPSGVGELIEDGPVGV